MKMNLYYTANSSLLSRRSPNLKYLKLKRHSRVVMQKCSPMNWGCEAKPEGDSQIKSNLSK